MILNDQTPPQPPAAPAPKKVNAAVLLITAAATVTVALLIAAGIILWLNQTSFESVDEIKPEELESVRIHMLNLVRGPQNRPDPPLVPDVPPDENVRSRNDPDIDPTFLVRPDFDVIFIPLRNADAADASVAPATSFLGEIRVRYKDGRRGTIYLRQGPDDRRDENSPMRVYMKIGSNWYRACSLKDFRTFAHSCAERGTRAGR